MHSMPLSMPLSWTESLDHLEHVMGPCWCFWAGPHQCKTHTFHLGHKKMTPTLQDVAVLYVALIDRQTIIFDGGA